MIGVIIFMNNIEKKSILKRIRKSDLRKSKKQPESESLARSIITVVNEGRKDRYMVMFNSVPVGDSRYSEGAETLRLHFEAAVDWAINTLKKEDRIIWYLRYQLMFCLVPIASGNFVFFGDKPRDKELIIKASTKLKELLGKMGYTTADTDLADIMKNPIMVDNVLRQKLSHYMGLPSPEVQGYVFGSEKIKDLYAKLDSLESKWASAEKSQIKQADEESKHTVTTLITFNDGWKWVVKDAEYCDLEARAMGHCGNRGDPRPGDRIISLREPTKKPGIWRPACTFILRKEGLISEMKGRENNKPDPKYFPYIVELLKNDIVKGIVGGGYAPEANFTPEDLPEGVRNSLYSAKPALMPIEHYLPEHGLDQYSKEMFKQRLAILCPALRDHEPPAWDENESFGYFYYGIVETSVLDFFNNLYTSISPAADQIVTELFEYSNFIARSVLTSLFEGKEDRIAWWKKAIRHDPDIAIALTMVLVDHGYEDDYKELYEEEVGENTNHLVEYLMNETGNYEREGKLSKSIDVFVENALSRILEREFTKLLDIIVDDDLECALAIGTLKVDREEGEPLYPRTMCTYFVNIEGALEVLSEDKYSRLRDELSSDSVQSFIRNVFREVSLRKRVRYRGDPYDKKMENVIEGITDEDIWNELNTTIENDPDFPDRGRA